jgi:hypothetical protein
MSGVHNEGTKSTETNGEIVHQKTKTAIRKKREMASFVFVTFVPSL